MTLFILQFEGELYSDEKINFRGFLIEVGTANEVSEKEVAIGEFIKLDTSIQKHVCGKVLVLYLSNKVSVKSQYN